MIEENLLQYGVLGLWTATLLIDKVTNSKTIKEVVKNNTVALTKVYEIIGRCQK